MNQLQIFTHELFGELKVTTIEEKEMFNLENVAWSLGYTRKSKGIDYLRHDRITAIIEKLDIATVDRDGQLFIDESALYDFIFEAGTAGARNFRKWITSEVIPSIRKHGAYATPKTIENIISNPDFGIQLLQKLKDESEKRLIAEQERNEVKNQHSLVLAQQKTDQPYATFGKVVSGSDASINIGAFAKLMYDQHGIKLGRNKMFDWLRNNNYLIKTGRERNNPKQQYIEQGLFETTATLVSRSIGDVESLTTLITGKGQVRIAEQLLQEYKVVI